MGLGSKSWELNPFRLFGFLKEWLSMCFSDMIRYFRNFIYLPFISIFMSMTYHQSELDMKVNSCVACKDTELENYTGLAIRYILNSQCLPIDFICHHCSLVDESLKYLIFSCKRLLDV